jgi:hypothetical protein
MYLSVTIDYIYVQKAEIQIEYYQNIDLNIIGAHLPIGQRGIHNKPVGVDWAYPVTFLGSGYLSSFYLKRMDHLLFLVLDWHKNVKANWHVRKRTLYNIFQSFRSDMTGKSNIPRKVKAITFFHTIDLLNLNSKRPWTGKVWILMSLLGRGQEWFLN